MRHPHGSRPNRAIASLAGPLRITNYGKIYEFSCKPDALDFGDLPDDEIRPFYRVLRLLQEMLFNPVHRITVPVASGEALFFNNQRVLHGRSQFAADSDRCMRSCNVEVDKFNSTLRLLEASQSSEAANMHLPHGALS